MPAFGKDISEPVTCWSCAHLQQPLSAPWRLVAAATHSLLCHGGPAASWATSFAPYWSSFVVLSLRALAALVARGCLFAGDPSPKSIAPTGRCNADTMQAQTTRSTASKVQAVLKPTRLGETGEAALHQAEQPRYWCPSGLVSPEGQAEAAERQRATSVLDRPANRL